MANYIEGNNFSGNKKGAIFNAGEGTQIIGNTITDQDVGIVNEGKGVKIERNIFKKSNLALIIGLIIVLVYIFFN